MAKKSRRPARGTTPTTRPAATTNEGAAESATTPPPSTQPADTTKVASTAATTSSTSTNRVSSGKPARRVRRTRQQTFFEKYRSWIIGGGFLAGILLIGFVFFQGANTKAFTCGSELAPGPVESLTPRPSIVGTPTPAPSGTAAPTATPAPTGTPGTSSAPGASATPAASPPPEPTPVPEPTNRLGFTTDILGRTHVQAGSTINYGFCPPTSGNHYNSPGRGPIPPQFYGPTEERTPGGWVHNMEHGAVVLAYRCPSGTPGTGDCATQAELDQMRQLVETAPANEIATSCPPKLLVVRLDTMATRFGQVAWGRALLTDDFDLDRAKTFDQQWREHDAVPEAAAC